MSTAEAEHERWMKLIESGAFILTYLQAVEPEILPRGGPVVVAVEAERDSMGLPRVDLLCADRDQLIAYVREHWGDEDGGWFQEYVVDRIVTAPELLAGGARLEGNS